MQTPPHAAELARIAREADDLHERSRRMLVDAVRDGRASGMSQREIAAAIGRSQPEVSRLLRFQGRSPLGRAVAMNRAGILRRLRAAGAANPRVFGSVSRGDDGPESDVDLLVDFVAPPSLFELARLESELSHLVGAEVDVVPSASLRPNLRERALSEAVPL